MKKPEITSVGKVFVAWSNTDLTEGRGGQYPLAVCKLESTALRLGEKGYVMGSDCPISEEIAVEINGRWLSVCNIQYPSAGDVQCQNTIDAKRVAIEKAKSLGMTDGEIKALIEQ